MCLASAEAADAFGNKVREMIEYRTRIIDDRRGRSGDFDAGSGDAGSGSGCDGGGVADALAGRGGGAGRSGEGPQLGGTGLIDGVGTRKWAHASKRLPSSLEELAARKMKLAGRNVREV